MSLIEIEYLSGKVEQRTLSRAQPLSIGSHFSNDISLEEEGVDVLHCRISWNGKSFEVMSGGSSGVDLNGNLVQHAALTDGDLLRIGSIDIVFRGSGPPPPARPERQEPSPAERPEENVGLQPVTDDEVPILTRASDIAREMGGPAQQKKPRVREEQRETLSPAPKPRPKPRRATPQYIDDTSDADDGGSLDFGDLPDPKQDTQTKPSKIGSLKTRLSGKPARPGEQDVARSPLVLGLGGGALALLLAAVTVWFIIGRETAQKHYDAAQQQLKEGNFQQAASLFESFIQDHPRHRFSEDARYGLGNARIKIALAGATPKWSLGLTQLQTFVKQNRERPNYETQIEKLRTFAATIAFGAAKRVDVSAKRSSVKPAVLNELLVVSRTAGNLLGRLYPADEQPTELNSRLADVHWQAEQAIATREAFLTTVASMEKSVKARRPHKALAARDALLTAHGNFRNDRQLARLLQETLDVEKSLVVVEDITQQAKTADHQPNKQTPLSFIRHTYSGIGENSVGRTVFAIAKGCCFGIDTITGKPLWRRVIGMDAPFFPVAVETSVSGVLLFDTNHNELMLLDRRTGALVWRQPLEERLSGAPLLHEGRAYVATSKGRLYQIVLESGLATKRLSFSQPLVAPPVLVRNETQLVVAGRASILYTLSVRPLSCTAVSFSGHSAGSVAAPLLTMGSLMLLTENNNVNTGRLRVFDTRTDKLKLKQIAAATVTGRIRNRPIIRGRQLFVTSSPERITAFAVSEDKERQPLLRIAETRVIGGHSGPLFLKAGADGRLWMAGSAFRSFRLLTDTIAYDEANRLATGLTTQPLQLVDRYFFVGRQQPFHRAVLFTPIEREQLTSRWRTLCGSAPIAMAGEKDRLVCVTETGDVYRFDETDVNTGGFVTESTTSLPVADTTETPLTATALTEGLLAISAGNPQPTLWLIDMSGRIVREIVLPQPLEASPIAIKAGIVLPLPGRLKIVLQNDGSPPEDYPARIEQGEKPKWRHLIPLDEDEFLAVNDSGRLSRIQFRNSDVPHLAEVNSVTLPQPVDIAPIVADGRLFVADAAGRLTMSDLSNLEMLSEIKLDAPASNRLWFVDGSLLVESSRKSLREFRVENGQLNPGWTLPLDGNSLAGAPLTIDGRLVVALKNGDVLSLNPLDGKIVDELAINQPLALGLRKVGDLLVLPTIDGSLHRVGAALRARQGRRTDQ
jgi:outer membrane protein assembly factor BamB